MSPCQAALATGCTGIQNDCATGKAFRPPRPVLEVAMTPPLPILPDPKDPRLTRRVTGHDQSGAEVELSVVEEGV